MPGAAKCIGAAIIRGAAMRGAAIRGAAIRGAAIIGIRIGAAIRGAAIIGIRIGAAIRGAAIAGPRGAAGAPPGPRACAAEIDGRARSAMVSNKYDVARIVSEFPAKVEPAIVLVRRRRLNRTYVPEEPAKSSITNGAGGREPANPSAPNAVTRLTKPSRRRS